MRNTQREVQQVLRAFEQDNPKYAVRLSRRVNRLLKKEKNEKFRGQRYDER